MTGPDAPDPRASRAASGGERACSQCGLPVRAGSVANGPSFCCSGCAVAAFLGAGAGESGADRLQARLVLSAFLATGVMVASLALYADHLPTDGARGLESEAASALRGLYRMAALVLATPVVILLAVPLLAAIARARRWVSTESLILCGTLAAYGASVWNTLVADGHVYFETATMVLVLFYAGRLLEVRAKDRARAHLAGLSERASPCATRLLAEGEREVPATDLRAGDRLRVRPGEVLAVDGEVEAGRAFVDTAALTGEAHQRAVGPGARVLAGQVPVDGALVVRVTGVVGERVQDQVNRILHEALAAKGAGLRMADRLAGVLLPLVLVLAGGTLAWHAPRAGLEPALLHALSVVLIACPCAFGLATPLALWTGLGAAWRRGALVRGADVLERLAAVDELVYDKTGTLTEAAFRLDRVELLDGPDEECVLALAAAVELHSEHPLGRALVEAARARGLTPEPARAFRVRAGTGVEGRVDGRAVALGRGEGPGADEHTAVVLRVDGQPRARFLLRTRLVPGAPETVEALRRAGVAQEILTGDDPGPAAAVAERLGLPFRARQLPADKARAVREHSRGGRARVAFVGDGLNDAAALAAAGVGIAVAGASPKSLAAADVHLLGSGIEVLPELLELARRVVRTARWNLVWACGYNVVGLAFAVRGALDPILAAAIMVASSAMVVVHSGAARPRALPRPRSAPRPALT